ncbi:MAG TPA: DUF3551 domain-containing protein [Pseudolabrys sp.]|jgi:hypothetical protein
MRISAAAMLLTAGLINIAQAANDGPWCYRDFDGPQYTNCYYYSARECLIVAGIRGGVCERNHGPVVRTPKKDKRKVQPG